jgi:hypothetical protein
LAHTAPLPQQNSTASPAPKSYTFNIGTYVKGYGLGSGQPVGEQFQLPKAEFINLKSQFATSSWELGGRFKTYIFAFFCEFLWLFSFFISLCSFCAFSRLFPSFNTLKSKILDHFSLDLNPAKGLYYIQALGGSQKHLKKQHIAITKGDKFILKGWSESELLEGMNNV